ncbi:transketolase-like TK C-terminal-containing protein, partial [Pseudoalteromonas ruthenica]
QAVERKDGPTSLIFTRQGLEQQGRDNAQVQVIKQGGYVLSCDGNPELIIIATGSEVQLAVDSAKSLRLDGKKVRVVSMPSTDVFDAQSAEYKESVLPSTVTRRIAVEAGIADY